MNKVIWIYWHQGWDKAPDISKRCLSTWEDYNPSWDVRKLCFKTLIEYIDLEKAIPGIYSKEITLTSLSDIIRILLLSKYGGVWADSTLLCRAPLDEWIEIYKTQEFFAFDKPGKDRLVSSWFLMAKENSYIVSKWFERTLEYWSKHNSTNNYFWFHYLFNDLYSEDPLFKEIWDNTPKMSANAPHYFTPYNNSLFTKINNEKIDLIDKVQSPVFKLTYKYDHTAEKKGTVLEHLINGNLKMSKMKILVVWYGSFQKNGTLGDYLSVKTLTNFLYEKNFDFHCASYKHFEGLHGREVLLDKVEPTHYDVILFCCGPIMKNHKNLTKLFNRFNSVYKIGIGVSLFYKDHFNYYNPFDFVLPREHGEINYEDIAIIAPTSINYLQIKSKHGKPTVGLILRDTQSEYGIENCNSEESNAHLMQLARELTRTTNSFCDRMLNLVRKKGIIIEIDNHLETSGLSPQQIENQYRQCDIILTTRFHGSMVALRNNIPFIAIDQIINGAKVYNLVSKTEYPFVWKISNISFKELKESASALLSKKHDDKILSSKLISESGANYSLNQLYAQLLAFENKNMIID